MAERLLAGDRFRKSTNIYDWLGHGIYFWEANPRRGLEYAEELKRLGRGRSPIKKPTVIGAVIALGLCLDLTTSAGIEQVRIAHKRLAQISKAANFTLPQNNPDGLRRNLDCAVIQSLHQIRKDDRQQAIDTVKGVFVEGARVYPTAGFFRKTHIQICVCSTEQIKGVFRVPAHHLSS